MCDKLLGGKPQAGYDVPHSTAAMTGTGSGDRERRGEGPE